MHSSVDLMRRILATVSDPAFLVDCAGSIRWQNAAAETTLGYPSAVLGSMRIDDIIALGRPASSGTSRSKGQTACGDVEHCRSVDAICRNATRLTCAVAMVNVDASEGWRAAIFRLNDRRIDRVTDVRDAQEALERREEHIRVTLNAIGEGVLAIDATGRVTELNAAAQRLTGWTESEALGRDINDVFRIVDATHRRRAPVPVMKVIAEGTARDLADDPILIARDGTERAIADSCTPIRDRDGVAVGAVLVFRDVTERLRIERELQALNATLEKRVAERTAQLAASEFRYHMLFESSPDALVKVDGQGCIVLVNRRAEHLLGWDRSELIGQSVDVLVPDALRAGHPAHRERYMHRAIPRPMGATAPNLRARRKDGSELAVDISLSPVETPLGPGVVAAIRDMTERRSIEESLRRREEQYRQLVETSSEVFYKLTRPQGNKPERFEYVSESILTITGRAADEFVNRPELWQTLVHAEDQAARLESMNAAFARREVSICTYRMHAANGEYRWIEEELRPLDADGDTTTSCRGVARDVTDRRQLELQLLQSQKMEGVGRLAGGIAHDFNNILTVIIGTADLAAAQLPSQDPLAAEIEEIRRAAERAAALTRQLLAFSRRQLLQPTSVDLNNLVANLLRMIRRLLGEDIEVVFNPTDGIGRVFADAAQIEQVILNLAVNARDAMPGGGRLVLAASEEFVDESRYNHGLPAGRYVVLSVRDNGEGMTDEIRRQIFEPFFTTKPQGKGSGLGLSVVYGIVQQSGGRIKVESQPGLGSAFTVYLPRTDQAESIQLSDADECKRGAGTILVVEDEEGVRRLAARSLTAAGFRVFEAANGREALALIEQHRNLIDLVLTDVVMPGMSGPQLIECVRAQYPTAQVLFTSGYTSDEIRHHGLFDGAANFVRKPYSPRELSLAVHRLLSGNGNRGRT